MPSVTSSQKRLGMRNKSEAWNFTSGSCPWIKNGCCLSSLKRLDSNWARTFQKNVKNTPRYKNKNNFVRIEWDCVFKVGFSSFIKKNISEIKQSNFLWHFCKSMNLWDMNCVNALKNIRDLPSGNTSGVNMGGTQVMFTVLRKVECCNNSHQQ